jgi:sporulation protein YabP
MMEERLTGRHSLRLEKRENLYLTGVQDIISFNETVIEALTDCGIVVVGGENLHISQLSIEKGNVDIDGKIDSIVYENENAVSGGFWGRLFK